MLERQHVPLQKRFLGLSAERDVERPARVRQTQHEHPALDPDTGDRRVELAEVDLALRAGKVRLRDRHLPLHQAELDPSADDVTRHRHLRRRRLVFGDQPLPDPSRRVTLLARRVQVLEAPTPLSSDRHAEHPAPLNHAQIPTAANRSEAPALQLTTAEPRE